MTFESNGDFIRQVKSDLNKKYIGGGKRIAGDISDKKITLFLEDSYGKHSAFMSQYFYGKIDGKKITGRFRPANYVIILLSVLFAVALESLIFAAVTGGYAGIVTPAVIIIFEIVYFVYLNKTSSENNEIIKKYLSAL
ncbi:MAG: hypothetical protein IIU39_03360 [Ruminococcus sp.]|nr:hypothetical protein [Ruminococcus sp.]